MYLWAPFILQNFLKKGLRVDSELWGYAPFLGQKWLICPEQKNFVTNRCYYFNLLISLFHCVIFKKILTADPELWWCTIFGPKMVHLPLTDFFWENYYYHSHLPISPFHCAKLKKNSSSGSRVMMMCSFWAQNGPFPQMRIFSKNLLMSLVYFIRAYLNVKNQSQILIY